MIPDHFLVYDLFSEICLRVCFYHSMAQLNSVESLFIFSYRVIFFPAGFWWASWWTPAAVPCEEVATMACASSSRPASAPHQHVSHAVWSKDTSWHPCHPWWREKGWRAGWWRWAQRGLSFWGRFHLPAHFTLAFPYHFHGNHLLCLVVRVGEVFQQWHRAALPTIVVMPKPWFLTLTQGCTLTLPFPLLYFLQWHLAGHQIFPSKYLEDCWKSSTILVISVLKWHTWALFQNLVSCLHWRHVRARHHRWIK